MTGAIILWALTFVMLDGSIETIRIYETETTCRVAGHTYQSAEPPYKGRPFACLEARET